MERKVSIANYVSSMVKTSMEHEEWRTLLDRQPVILSGRVLAQFRRNFASMEYRTMYLELRGMTLVFHNSDSDVDDEVYAVPLEFSVVSFNDESQTISCMYGDKTSVSFHTSFLAYKSWRESVLGAVDMQSVSKHDYEFKHCIGRGATADVYLAIERRSGKRVAIKVMKQARLLESETALRRLVNERLALELLRDFPFALDLEAAFQTPENLYLVTNYCEGGDLERYLARRQNSLESSKVKRVVAEIVIALEYLHQHGIVYRDLKAENVLLEADGHVRLADFGLCKALHRRDNSVTDSFCGTMGYIAPEVVEGKPYGLAVDKWSLGSLIFRLITGRTPFYTGSRENYFRAVKNGRVLFPDSVPEDARDLIRNLMDKDPLKRMSFDELKAHSFFSGLVWSEVVDRCPLDEEMFVTSELRQMDTMQLNQLKKSAESNRSKISGSRWDSGLSLKRVASLLGMDKKAHIVRAVPGFLYSHCANCAVKIDDNATTPRLMERIHVESKV